MTDARWKYLMADEHSFLTPEEMAEGWHFCRDWDGLLIGPGMFECASCTCNPMKKPEAKPDGGKAFACYHGPEDGWQEGLSLRDYFAAACLSGWVVSDGDICEEVVARRCYEVADAMLAERNKQ